MRGCRTSSRVSSTWSRFLRSRAASRGSARSSASSLARYAGEARSDDRVMHARPKARTVMWPVVLHKVGFLARVQLEDTDMRPDKFVLFVSNNSNLAARYDGAITIAPGAKHFALAFSANSLPLTAPGTMTYALELTKGDKSVTLEPNLSTGRATRRPAHRSRPHRGAARASGTRRTRWPECGRPRRCETSARPCRA